MFFIFKYFVPFNSRLYQLPTAVKEYEWSVVVTKLEKHLPVLGSSLFLVTVTCCLCVWLVSC